MALRVPRGVVALAVLGGGLWALSWLLPWLVPAVGINSLAGSLFVLVIVEYGRELLVAVAAVGVLWVGVRRRRSGQPLGPAGRLAVLAAVTFLLLTPLVSGTFYYALPQPDSTTVRLVAAVGRDVAVAALVGSLSYTRVSATS